MSRTYRRDRSDERVVSLSRRARQTACLVADLEARAAAVARARQASAVRATLDTPTIWGAGRAV